MGVFDALYIDGTGVSAAGSSHSVVSGPANVCSCTYPIPGTKS
jgi:hypothetical protein